MLSCLVSSRTRDKKVKKLRLDFVFSLSTRMASAAPEQAVKASGNWSQLLSSKVVFVTGAGGGIGSAIAQTCVLHGARVVVADVRRDAAEKVVANIIEAHPQGKESVVAIELDVTSEEQIANAVQTVVDKWKTIDVLVNK